MVVGRWRVLPGPCLGGLREDGLSARPPPRLPRREESEARDEKRRQRVDEPVHLAPLAGSGSSGARAGWCGGNVDQTLRDYSRESAANRVRRNPVHAYTTIGDLRESRVSAYASAALRRPPRSTPRPCSPRRWAHGSRRGPSRVRAGRSPHRMRALPRTMYRTVSSWPW